MKDTGLLKIISFNPHHNSKVVLFQMRKLKIRAMKPFTQVQIASKAEPGFRLRHPDLESTFLGTFLSNFPANT